ncbi:hypothetical protein [Deinococcus sp.]|uniref:hypothetical protein n=1 Tax=Deinococcus sp. TaxID=47478 RepID=UPI0028698215|nr:hypothetical protein [Deinococcus sp.]
MTRRAVRSVLIAAALLAGGAGAHPRSRPLPAPPVLVGFAQLHRVLDAARMVTVTLSAGPAVMTATGQRIVTLMSAGQGVARVLLRPDGTLAALPGGKVKPGPRPATQVALTTMERAGLDTQIAALTVSGAVQVTPGDYRAPLLSGGVVVAALRLDRVSLRVRPDGPPPGSPPGPRGRDGA